MAILAAASARRRAVLTPRSARYDFIADGIVASIFFRVLLLVAPIQSVLLLPVQGSTAAFILVLLSPAILVSSDTRYFRLLVFYAGFILLYAMYMALSLSGYLIDEPDMTRLTVIREVYIFGYLKQTHVTQGVYLFAAALLAFLVYTYWQEAFLKYAFYGVLLLSAYGFYEFIFYAIFHSNGDFLSNRNFGDLDTAAAGIQGEGTFATGSYVEPSTLFGSDFMRLKSLTGEPSMYALSVTPFAVYAFGRRWWLIFGVLLTSIILSTSSTGVIGLLVGLSYVQIRRRHEAALYIAASLFIIVLLYATASPVHDALDNLLFEKVDTISGNIRIQSFTDHASVALDANPVRALFGLGFGTVRSTDMLSNLLANTGFVGLLLYSAAILTPCVLLRGGEDRDALVAALLAIFAMEMLSVSEYAYLPPWIMVALGFARSRDQRKPQLLSPRAHARQHFAA